MQFIQYSLATAGGASVSIADRITGIECMLIWGTKHTLFRYSVLSKWTEVNARGVLLVVLVRASAGTVGATVGFSQRGSGFSPMECSWGALSLTAVCFMALGARPKGNAY